jgi:hypothetical protein
MDIGSIKIQPMNATFGVDTPQSIKVLTKADVSGNLDGKAFLLYGVDSSGNLVKKYVWLSKGGVGVDPAIGGHSGIEVDYAENDSASVIATKIAAAVNPDPNFNATASGSVVTIVNAFHGYAPPPRDSSVPTGFAFEVLVQGSKKELLGFLDGDIEWSVGKSMVDITAHQRGAEVLGSIMNGTECEVTLSLKETTKEKLLKALRGQGGSFIPEGVDATELTGFGQYKNFTNSTKYASRLVLHPVNKMESDRSEDICFWLAFPMLESITFSGENIQTIPLTFKIYPDLTKDHTIQHFAVGDWTQLA